ncbi:MAG: VanZ family protein [Bacteroidota bacterium]
MMPFLSPHMKTKEKLSVGYLVVVLALHIVNLGDATQWNEDFIGPIPTDKMVHYLMFVPWAFFAKGVWEPRNISLFRLSAYSTILLSGIIIAVLMETTQYVLPYREFSGEDMFMNVSGVLMGYAIRWFKK